MGAYQSIKKIGLATALGLVSIVNTSCGDSKEPRSSIFDDMQPKIVEEKIDDDRYAEFRNLAREHIKSTCPSCTKVKRFYGPRYNENKSKVKIGYVAWSVDEWGKEQDVTFGAVIGICCIDDKVKVEPLDVYSIPEVRKMKMRYEQQQVEKFFEDLLE